MKRQTAIPTREETTRLPIRGLPQHAAIHAVPERALPTSTAEDGHFGHDFSQAAVRPSAPMVGQHYATSACPVFPRTCPFGGACHVCPAPAQVQTKLKVNQPGDKYEQEADRVAEQVMRMPELTPPEQTKASERTQGLRMQQACPDYDKELRQRPLEEEGEEEAGILQNKDMPGRTPQVTPALPRQIDGLRGKGRPLPESTRAFFEPRLGHDLSRVRVHTNEEAADAARSVNALAYTVGRDVVFGSGQYAPETKAGKRLLAHELTHVAQQGRVGKRSRFAEGRAVSILRVTATSRRIQRLSVEDCSEADAKQIRSAAGAAPPAIGRTINAIIGRSQSAASRATFATYFGGNNRASIGLRLGTISGRLANATVECETPGSFMYDYFCGRSLGYVRPVPAFFGFGNIHVCQPGFRNLTNQQRMAALVHEAAHRYLDADDEAYYTLNCRETAETRALSNADRRDNADSYRCLVQTLG